MHPLSTHNSGQYLLGSPKESRQKPICQEKGKTSKGGWGEGGESAFKQGVFELLLDSYGDVLLSMVQDAEEQWEVEN